MAKALAEKSATETVSDPIPKRYADTFEKIQQHFTRATRVMRWRWKASVLRISCFWQASAAEKQERREEAELLDEWLREMCGLFNAKDRTEVLDAFMDPRYRVDCPPKLFSLDAEDIDTILASLSLGTRKLVKNAWNELRLHGEAGGGSRPGGGAHGNSR